MISIIIPVYNQAKKINKCLDSILAQTYNDIEIIIVNDGSKDNLEAVLEIYKKIFNQNNIRYKIINQENSGPPAARNRGAKEAKGEYIFFCDSDAILDQNCLKLMREALIENKNISYAYSSFKFGRKLFRLWYFDVEKLKKMPYIHTMSLIKSEHFPGFDESLKKFQDWDLWLTMLKRGHKGVWVNKILFKISSGGTISRWLPSFAYKLMPFLKTVKKYKEAKKILFKKHSLPL